jgi:hypothetical protein
METDTSASCKSAVVHCGADDQKNLSVYELARKAIYDTNVVITKEMIYSQAISYIQDIIDKHECKSITVEFTKTTTRWLEETTSLKLRYIPKDYTHSLFRKNFAGIFHIRRYRWFYTCTEINENYVDAWNMAFDYFRKEQGIKFEQKGLDANLFWCHQDDHGVGVGTCKRCESFIQREKARKQKNSHKKTYIIGHSGGNEVKIGIATNPEKRLAQLSTACPYDLEILCLIDGDVEKDLHNSLYGYKTRGEWFKIDRKVLFRHLQAQNLQYKLA